MFEARAKGKPWGRPRFKPRRKYKSFTLLQAGWELLTPVVGAKSDTALDYLE